MGKRSKGTVKCKNCEFYHTDSCPSHYTQSGTERDCWVIDDEEGFCSYGEGKGTVWK